MNIKQIFGFSLMIAATAIPFSCGISGNNSEKSEQTEQSESEMKTLANDLAHQLIITDGHIDLPYRMREKGEWIDVSNRTDEGDFDYPRAIEGGLNAPFMSIYIPAAYQQSGGAKELADTLINSVEEIVKKYPGKFALAGSVEDVIQNVEKGLISLPMGMENGAPIEDDLANVEYFYERGIRYITLTHSKDNLICDSSYDTTRTWSGLSEFGKLVVAEMNRTGIMVDISHVTDDTFYQVMEISKAPVIASHSSLRHFTPGFERNMNDEMIKKLGENGGVIQINFASSFLDGNIADENNENESKLRELLEEKGLDSESAEAREIIKKYKTENPTIYADVSAVADHIDRVVEIAGIDHVGIGSDFDGVGDSLPYGLKDVSGYPNLIYELLKRGYSEEDIQKICSGNVFRVWNKVAAVALELQNE